MASNFEVRFARTEDSNAIKEAEKEIIKILGKKGRKKLVSWKHFTDFRK